MVQTTSINKKIYSVDMMHAYVNIFKPKATLINIEEYKQILNEKGWGDPINKVFISPNDVLNDKQKYKEEYNRIIKSDLKYPILIANNNIIDGVHRFTKAHLANKKQIKAIIFDDALLNKFLLDKNGNYNKTNNITNSLYIEMFVKRFKLKK